MKKKLAIIAATFSALPKLTFAVVCPACTVAVGAGVGLAQWLGIDDSISGLWIGALIVSMSIWTINWLNAKNIKFIGRKILVFAAYYLVVIWPLWQKGFIAKNPLNTICGMDKLLFGVILGSVLFSAAVIALNILLKKNEGKSYFKGQKIALPVGLLVIASLVLYYTC